MQNPNELREAKFKAKAKRLANVFQFPLNIFSSPVSFLHRQRRCFRDVRHAGGHLQQPDVRAPLIGMKDRLDTRHVTGFCYGVSFRERFLELPTAQPLVESGGESVQTVRPDICKQGLAILLAMIGESASS
jgi:hypothetical protein